MGTALPQSEEWIEKESAELHLNTNATEDQISHTTVFERRWKDPARLFSLYTVSYQLETYSIYCGGVGGGYTTFMI